MVFGGPKALGLVPSLDNWAKLSVRFLQVKLERITRTGRTHLWRGCIAVVILVFLFGTLGYSIDQLVFAHSAFTALAVFFVAKFLSLKSVWQQLQNSGAVSSANERRRFARKPIGVFANYYVPAALLFIVGGFSFLLPFSCLYAGSLAAEEMPVRSFFLQPFDGARALAAWPGELMASVVLVFALLFWPAAHWKRGLSSMAHLGKRVRYWPITIVAYGLNWSLEIKPSAKTHSVSGRLKWIGPEDGSAQLKPADLKSGLIVALIAFGLTNALLALLWLAAVIG